MTTATAIKAPFKFAKGQIVESCYGYNSTRYSFYVVTRVTAHNAWFKPITQSILDTKWGRDYGFQKGECVPDVRTIDGKLVPISTGEEFRLKIKTWEDSGNQYCYRNYQGIMCEWDGTPRSYDTMD